MRARQNFIYIIERIFDPQEIFLFIQQQASLSDSEMYQTFNMGADYTIFLPKKHMERAQKVVKKNGFEALDAGYVERGKRQVVIRPKHLVFTSSTLDLRD